MQYTIAAAAAALLASIPAVRAASANIVNNCDFDVSLWSISADSSPYSPTTINSNGGTYSEEYQTPSIGGVSLKLANGNSVADPVTQFEYTFDGFIWYDISNINCIADGCPFEQFGMHLVSGNSCPTVTCPAGVARCSRAYNEADDNENSFSCQSSADITLYLCATSGQNMRRDTPARYNSRALHANEARSSPAQHGHRRLGHPHWRH